MAKNEGIQKVTARHKANLQLMEEFGFTFTMPCPGNMHGSEGIPPSRSSEGGADVFRPAFMSCTYADCAAAIVADVEERKYLGKKIGVSSPDWKPAPKAKM